MYVLCFHLKLTTRHSRLEYPRSCRTTQAVFPTAKPLFHYHLAPTLENILPFETDPYCRPNRGETHLLIETIAFFRHHTATYGMIRLLGTCILQLSDQMSNTLLSDKDL